MSEHDKELTLIREVAASLDGIEATVSLSATAAAPLDASGFPGEIRTRSGRRHPVILHPVSGVLGLAAVERIARSPDARAREAASLLLDRILDLAS